MDVKKIAVGDKDIIVIDNAFDYKFVLDTELFANNSYYKHSGIDYDDGRMSSYVRSYNLCSIYSLHDIQNTGILTNNKFIENLFNGRAPIKIKVHLLRPFDVCVPHVDDNYETFLYYINAKWDVTYGGQTMFFSNDMTDVVYTSLFKPNRAVWFDGSIPHMGTPPTAAAPYPRLVLAMHFLKE